jgi:hypothetical protein
MNEDFLKQIQTQFERLQKMYDMNEESADEAELRELMQSDFDGLTDEIWSISKIKKLNYKKNTSKSCCT